MSDSQRDIPRESPYRRSATPRAAEGPREMSLGLAATVVVLILLLVKVLSVEPERDDSFGRFGTWHAAGHSHAPPHHG
jgi:hypothetical protein